MPSGIESLLKILDALFFESFLVDKPFVVGLFGREISSLAIRLYLFCPATGYMNGD